MESQRVEAIRGRVLIVDDDLMVRDSLEMLFEHFGWQVVTVSSGDEVIELAPSLDYQLALVDHRMDGIDGVEVARRLKSISPAPVFMLTGCVDPELRKAAEEAGVERFFSKPVKAATILEAVEQL